MSKKLKTKPLFNDFDLLVQALTRLGEKFRIEGTTIYLTSSNRKDYYGEQNFSKVGDSWAFNYEDTQKSSANALVKNIRNGITNIIKEKDKAEQDRLIAEHKANLKAKTDAQVEKLKKQGFNVKVTSKNGKTSVVAERHVYN